MQSILKKQTLIERVTGLFPMGKIFAKHLTKNEHEQHFFTFDMRDKIDSVRKKMNRSDLFTWEISISRIGAIRIGLLRRTGNKP